MSFVQVIAMDRFGIRACRHETRNPLKLRRRLGFFQRTHAPQIAINYLGDCKPVCFGIRLGVLDVSARETNC